MYEDDIKAVREWCNSNERTFSYAHTEEDDGEDVIFVSSGDYEEFCDWLTENHTDLICIHGKIGKDGVWFSSTELEDARFYRRKIKGEKMNEPSCTSCEHIADFAGNYTECVLLHRFVDWFYWKNLSPDDCPKRKGGDTQ